MPWLSVPALGDSVIAVILPLKVTYITNETTYISSPYKGIYLVNIFPRAISQANKCQNSKHPPRDKSIDILGITRSR